MRRVLLLLFVLAVAALPSLAFGYGTPVISLDASALPTGALTSWSNTGSSGGSFSNDSTTVNVAVTGGKNSVTFTGSNWMKASFTAPSSITGASPYTVVAQVYNPGVGGEEAYLCWAHRGTGPRCAQYNYGNAASYGAITHFAGDMGFANMLNNTPPASMWHVISITYDGVTEKLYVDGLLNNSATKTLNLWAGDPIILGQAFGNADGSGKGQAFSGSMASLQVFSETLAAADVKSLSNCAFITGQVTSGGTGLSGATVYYKLSANASVSPLGTVIADSSGNYTIALPQNTGTVYVAAGKTGYVTSADSSQSVATSDISGVNFSLTAQNSITGNVSDGANVYNAAISVSLNADGSSPSQTVYTDSSGNYTAWVNQNTTYYLICKKSAHVTSSVLTVPVVTSNMTAQNFTMTKNAAVKLVDVDAGGLTVGSHTTADTWANGGTMAGTFNPNAAYTVLSAIGAAGRQAISFANNVRFTSSWSTSTVPWPSALAGGDVQYSTVAWIYAPASTDVYLDWSTGTGAQRGANTVSSSWMRYRYNSADQWGESDHGSGTWMGWLGTNQASQATTPAFGAWHMIVNTYDGRSEKLYVDDVKKSNTTGDNTVRTFSPVANNMNIGGPVGGNTFTGYINKIQVYDQALAQADIDTLWAAGNATNYTISGTVSASGGGGIGAATVTVYSDSGCTTVVTTATADGSGNYTTAGLPQSTTYYLKASKTGYVTSPTALTVSLGTSNYTGANISISLIPSATITGQVTESGTGTPLAGAKVYVSSSANASVSPAQVVTTDGSGNYSATVSGGTWYFCASQDTHKTSADLTITNADGSAQSGKNIALVADSTNNIPQKSSLLFSVLSDSLPTTQGADTGNWAVYHPLGASALTKQNSPTVDLLGGKSFVMNHNASADALRFMNLAQPNAIAMNGATITTVVKPVRIGTVNNYQPVVSVLLGQLELVIRNGDGLLGVGRKGTDAPNFWSTYNFADGVKHIVSYVVQANGYFQVYVDGVSVWNYTASTADMTSITAQTWYATDISIGKGWNGDGWSSFNGDIADTFVYKTALSNADRIALEGSLGAKFGVTMPIYHTLTASAGAGGTITPSGSLIVIDGSNQTFTIAPSVGYRITDVTLDGVSQGAIGSLTLNGIIADHTVVASFAIVPQHTISGTVTAANGGAPISGATVYISQTANAFVGTPAYTATTDGSGNWSKVVYDGAYYACAGATDYYYSADQALNISADASGVNFALRSSIRNIPQTGSLLFGAVTDSLPNSGATGTWTPLYTTDARTLGVRAGTPSTAIVGGVKWVSNSYAGGDGYTFGGTYWDGTGQHPIACTGASIVATVCPTRTAGGSWSEIVDIFYSTLGLSVKDDTGEIQVRRANDMWGTGYIIPDGQKTVVGLVVQPTGEFVVYANGNAVYTNTSTADVTSLIPGTTPYGGGNAQGAFGTYVNVGRNQPDSWTTYNGKIGDVFVYTTSLGDSDRQTLESDLKNKFDIVTHTITASAGANGTVSPAGAYNVVHGASQTYTIAPDTGYHIADVLVDGSTIGAQTTYTFNNVTTDQTISATFAINTYTLTYAAGANGSISGTSPQTVNYGGDGTEVTAVPDAGYHFVSWSDGVLTASRTDLNVTADISVTASFAINTYTLTYAAGANGSISGTSPQTVNHGGDGTEVTAHPDAGYHFVSWSDGVLTAARTDTGVIANITVTATFAISAHTITASAGANGAISPSGPVSVNDGADQSFTITPNDGFAVADVLVDAASVGAVTSYDFTGVTADHAIAVSFKLATKPYGVINRSVLNDPGLVGKTVKAWGKVVSINGTLSFEMNDGYSSNVTVNCNGVALPAGFSTTSTAIVTGLVNADHTIKAYIIEAY